MRPTVAQLEALTALATTGSISAAARHLGLAQPTVSTALARLERQAGVTLIQRTPTGATLTEAGRHTAEAASKVLTHLDALTALLDSFASTPSPVRIAASYTIAEHLLPAWLADCPVPTQVEVCNSARVQRQLLAGAADLGFIEGASLTSGLRGRTLTHDELVLVVAPTHPWASSQTPIRAFELISPPPGSGGLVVREEGSGARQVLEKALRSQGVCLPEPVQVMGSNASLLAAVEFSGAYACIARAAAAHALEAGSVVEVPTELDLRRRLRLITTRAGTLYGPALTAASHITRAATHTATRTATRTTTR